MHHALFPIYHSVILHGGLPLHAALVEVRGEGIIFAGREDAGKTTTSRRLEGLWRPLCDDETLVVFDKNRGFRAHPFPTWSDYFMRNSNQTRDVEYSVPLKALFFLEQAPVDEVVPIGQGQAAALITHSAVQVLHKLWGGLETNHKRELTLQVFDNACTMAKQIPAFILRQSLTGKFWEEVEEALSLNL